MCSETNSHLESIQQFVLNQDKIVTYRWLSKKLNIHTNTSKQLLYTFSLNNTEDNLLVTYLLSGSTEDGVKVLIASQSDIDKVKSGFDEVLCEHVYSVQKASPQICSSQLYLADYSCHTSDNELSSISSRKVEERKLRVVSSDKTVCGSSSSGQPTASKTSLKTSPVTGKVQDTKTKEDSTNNKKQEISQQPLQDKKKVVASPVKSKVVPSSKNFNKKGAQPKGGGIGAFFNKHTEKKKDEPPKETEAIRINVKERDSKKVEQGQGSEESMEVVEDRLADATNFATDQKSLPKTPVIQKKNTNKKSKKRKNNKQEDNTPARKRKRIVLASDSESEEGEENDVYVEEEPERPDEVTAPVKGISESEGEDEVIPPTPFGEKPKKRMRKQVDRTFVDEDGFVITKKEYVYLSCSDDENREKDGSNITPKKVRTPEEKQPDKKEDKISEEEEAKDTKQEEKGKTKAKGEKKGGRGRPAKSPKKAPPNKKQQPSITSFFKQK